MNHLFAPIGIDDYVALYVKANPADKPAKIRAALSEARCETSGSRAL